MTEGRKDDSGKARYDLVPPEALDALAELYGIGARKYADRGWEDGMKWGRIFAAMMRHAWKWWRGETYDKVDGQHHLSSVAWCAFALFTYELTHRELDDRPSSVKLVAQIQGIAERAPPACPDLDQELPDTEQYAAELRRVSARTI